ncbi:uncharacterized protein LOC111359859 [Spodoptera litura]|uniref:Uncharacterized protein LOC111359859 n=1 Tax=Spodoptera litura TaxID=69820 RepID=A0A9J7EME9_SPOLT|nr:uncharacterized protein LOC111359859 [Spodoptera litura]XP_022831321.1 uncharacterized protein LOC111359859 [Spodoptera litura]XP_022831322.1 uncharacterized protein LOC111359859 [Spodoptera litura]
MAMCTDTDTDSERPPNRIEIDFRSTCYEKIPLWKSWAAKGKVQEAINQLLFLEKQTRAHTSVPDVTARILVAIVQIYFEAKNWLALNEQILISSRKRSQPKEAVLKMVQECITFIDKIPDKANKMKLIETLSFVTEGKAYLKEETALLIRILNKINEDEQIQNETPAVSDRSVPLNFMDPADIEIPKKRKILDRHSKEILFNLHKYFNGLKNQDMSSIYQTSAAKLTSDATGVPFSSVKKVIFESKRTLEEGKPFTSSKKLLVSRKNKFNINDFDRAAIRQVIIDYYYEYYNEDKEFPIMTSLHEAVKEKLNYPGSCTTLRREVARMGFHWKMTEGNSGILVEKHKIRFQRINFLTKIAEYRSQGRPIVYASEVYIDTSISSNPSTRGNGLIIVHAGGSDGFVPNALAMFETNDQVEARPHYLNTEDFIKWIENDLMPNLKPKSVVVIDNIFYQNILENPAPGPHACKQEMLDWLDFRNIIHSSSMLKPQLYQLILEHKKTFKEFKIDCILRKNNHSVLRLPPYHPELNPFKKTWLTIKQNMGKRTEWCKQAKNITKFVKTKINSIDVQEWKNACDQAIREERKYIGHEAAIDALTERLEKNVCDSSEESDADNDIIMGEAESDVELT